MEIFCKLDEILGTRPATRPPVLLETLNSQPLLSDHDSDETNVEEVQEGSVQDHSGVTDDHSASDNQNYSGNSTVSVSGISPSRHGSSSSSAKDDSDENTTTGKAGVKGEKKKRSKGEVLEDAMTKVMKTMNDGLRNSDKMFMELEEKGLKFEEQQRREEHEFQLRMIQILQSGMGGNSMYPPQYPTSPSPYYSPHGCIGVARGGHGRAFALPSLNFALPSNLRIPSI